MCECLEYADGDMYICEACAPIYKALYAKWVKDGGGHVETEECWCGPKVERYENADIVIHNEGKENI
jgi:hypothetical protein